MKIKYIHHGSYLNYTLKPSDSPVWKSVIRSKDLLSAGLIWQIGNDSSVSFWFDNWLETNCLQDILQLSVDSIPCLGAKVSDFINTDKRWDIDRLKNILRDHNIIHKIVGIPLPISDIADSLSWGCTSSGEFSIKFATWLAHGLNPAMACPLPYALDLESWHNAEDSNFHLAIVSQGVACASPPTF